MEGIDIIDGADSQVTQAYTGTSAVHAESVGNEKVIQEAAAFIKYRDLE